LPDGTKTDLLEKAAASKESPSQRSGL